MRSTKLPSWIERLAGLSPVPVPPHVFALEPERLTYGRFERSGGRFQVTEFRSVELPPDGFQHGLLGGPPKDLAAFKEQVAALVRSLSGPLRSASLVLPDSWLRVTFAESGELARSGEAREEELRFRLKRLVPFRVDELRIQGVSVTPLAAQEEPLRLLLGFAVEPLLSAVERAFDEAGVQLGQISSASLSLLAGLTPPAGGGLEAVVLVGGDGYTLVFARDGEPVLHRFKAAGDELAATARSGLVSRDLKLTRTFLEQQFPGDRLARVLVAAPEALTPQWLAWMEEGLGIAAEALGREHLPRTGGLPELPWVETAPLLGAANREVA